MAEDKGIGEGENKDASTSTAAAATTDGNDKKKTQRRGILSRVWKGIFRLHGDDFEKRLQYISKEEAAVVARLKRRSYTWRRMTRNLIVISVILEVTFYFFVTFLLLCLIVPLIWCPSSSMQVLLVRNREGEKIIGTKT